MSENNNPMMVLWNGSLIVLGFVFHILFPILWLAAVPIVLLVILCRRARRRRDERYSWAVPLSQVSKSGYQRRRHGRFH